MSEPRRRPLPIRSAIALLFACALWPQSPAPPLPAAQGPALLTFSELQQLYRQAVPPPPLAAKLHTLLTEPFVSNGATARGLDPLRPLGPHGRRLLRVAQWNIERGLEFDAIRLAFTDPRAFGALVEDDNPGLSAKDRAAAVEEAAELRQADVVVLNEVDWGVNRTLFRNVAAELAQATGMNYAYGVEFVEVDPITMGLDQKTIAQEVEETYTGPGDSKQEALDEIQKVMQPTPARYLGLHGNAILSRYPLSNVRLVPYKFQAYDWYTDEKKKLGDLGKAEGATSLAVVKEQMIRQVRRGGRMVLIADLDDPSFPGGRITVVATHL